ncbi:MAG: hypothetical protein ABL977_00210 [Candidatus Eisenbacteria bacterium]
MLKLGAFFAMLAAALALAFLLFVWPTRWRYDHMTVDGNIVLVRLDRFSGDADMLVPDEGWVPVEAPIDSTGNAAPAVL